MKKIKRYSEAFKKQVVSEYEQGTAVTQLQKKYGITGGQTVQSWIKKYSKEGMRHETIYIQKADEVDRVKELEAQVKELQQSLGKVTLEKLKLEAILAEIAPEDVEEQVKKNEA